MVFYVCHGRVQVDISGVQFSAGKGCVFQVPRGNFALFHSANFYFPTIRFPISRILICQNLGNYYSFANTYDKDARLFFTQGCVPVEPDGSAAASKPAVAERESTTEGSRTTGGTKGRPRGKQKGGNESKQ